MIVTSASDWGASYDGIDFPDDFAGLSHGGVVVVDPARDVRHLLGNRISSVGAQLRAFGTEVMGHG